MEYTPLTHEEIVEFDLVIAGWKSEAGAEADTYLAERLLAEVMWQRKTVAALVRSVSLNEDGKPQTCKGCGADIWWMKNRRREKPAPVTLLGLNHFADCPARKQFEGQHG